MKLKTHFHNISKPKHIQTQIDCIFRDTLLNLCDGVENLYSLRNQFLSNPNKQYSEWRVLCLSAFQKATQNLSEKEKKRISIDIEFV